MNHTHSIGTSFMTHGIEGIGAHHKTHQLMAAANARRLDDVNGSTSLRHHLGSLMISIGAAVAGKTHDIQERQATRPSHTSAKPGAVPTR